MVSSLWLTRNENKSIPARKKFVLTLFVHLGDLLVGPVQDGASWERSVVASASTGQRAVMR